MQTSDAEASSSATISFSRRRHQAAAQIDSDSAENKLLKSTRRGSLKRWYLVVFLVGLLANLSYILYHMDLGFGAISTRERHMKPQLFGHPRFCKGSYIYVYELPSEFNAAFVKDCKGIRRGQNYCPHLSNLGLGPASDYGSARGGAAVEGWFASWQYSLELYFHQRMLRYPCRTDNPEEAEAFYVPYYAGLDLMRRQDRGENKSELYRGLLSELGKQPYLVRKEGRDHFLSLGRIASDFRHTATGSWGNEKHGEGDPGAEPGRRPGAGRPPGGDALSVLLPSSNPG